MVVLAASVFNKSGIVVRSAGGESNCRGGEGGRMGKSKMANFMLRGPTNLRTWCLSASSNGSSEQSGGGGPVILELPLDKIRRPLMRTRANDPSKVQQLMESISQIGLQVPIDVLEVDGIYYGFSGCHRYEAHQRLGLPTIRCKVRRATKETLRHHLRNLGVAHTLAFQMVGANRTVLGSKWVAALCKKGGDEVGQLCPTKLEDKCIYPSIKEPKENEKMLDKTVHQSPD